MPTTHPRRIVRRAVMVLAVVVLLPVWYVGSYLSSYWMYGADLISMDTMIFLDDTFFSPLVEYQDADSVCANLLSHLSADFLEAGSNGCFFWSHREVEKGVLHIRSMEPIPVEQSRQQP